MPPRFNIDCCRFFVAFAIFIAFRDKAAFRTVKSKCGIKRFRMLPHEVSRDFLVFLLLSGMRVGESRQLKWAHVDFDNKLLTAPREITKSDREHRLPLSVSCLLHRTPAISDVPYLGSVSRTARLKPQNRGGLEASERSRLYRNYPTVDLVR